MKLFTIGFTEKPASRFFELLESAGVLRVVDTRLNNVSQLAGFTKKDDLAFFLKRVANIEYRHVPLLAPTQTLLDRLKKGGGDWTSFEAEFLRLLQERRPETSVKDDVTDRSCLLCSEHLPAHCHRRLVAEHLKSKWPSVEIVHLH